MTREPEAQGDALLQRLLGDVGDHGELANDLLREFAHGYPVQRLRQLLRSSKSETAKSGAWIASELGRKFRPLLTELPAMLGHSEVFVRYFAIDAVLVCCDPEHNDLIAQVLSMWSDESSAVRAKVFDFVTRASVEQLRAALDHMESSEVGGFAMGLRRVVEHPDRIRVREELRDVNPLVRRLALAAAVRSRKQDLVRLAAQSDDPEIKKLAEGVLNSGW